MDGIRVFIGYDARESAAYHVCSESIIRTASVPVAIHPLAGNMLAGFDGQRDGTNAFIFSRYIVPYLCEFKGYALFIDGDMVLTRDIKELWDYRHELKDKAVAVVQHNYKTKFRVKYQGSTLESPNVDYPRKNWSSVMLWNCEHPANKILTPEFVSEASPQDIHRFNWLDDKLIGQLPPEWNYLVGEQAPSSAALYHYTLGAPGLKSYVDDHGSWHWHFNLVGALQCGGEDITAMVQRSRERTYAV